MAPSSFISRWADVYSYVPNQGRVDLKIKHPLHTALLRIPEFARTPASEIACTVNGERGKFDTSGRYIRLIALKPGDRVQMNFPIHERTVKLTVMRVDYSLIVRGSTVVSIDPPGQYRPYSTSSP